MARKIDTGSGSYDTPYDLRPEEDFSERGILNRAVNKEMRQVEQGWRDSQPEQQMVDWGDYRRDLTQTWRPQQYMSDVMGARARAMKAIVAQRPQTLSQFPGLQAALAQADLDEEDARNLINMGELDAAFTAFTSTSDPIAQRNILLSMNDIQRAGFAEFYEKKLAELARAAADTSLVGDALSVVGKTLEVAMTPLQMANDAAYHAVAALTYAAATGKPGYAFFNPIAAWKATEAGRYDQNQIDQLSAEYGEFETKVLLDLSREMEKGFDDEGNSPYDRWLKLYVNNERAQEIVRGVTYAYGENPRLLELMRGIEMASLSNPTQIAITRLFGVQTSNAAVTAAGLGNFTTRLVADPTVFGGKIQKVHRALKYSAFKLAPTVERGTQVAADAMTAERAADSAARAGLSSERALEDVAGANAGELGASGVVDVPGAGRAGAMPAAGTSGDRAVEVADAVEPLPPTDDPMRESVRGVLKYRRVRRFFNELGKDLGKVAEARKAEQAGEVRAGTAAALREAIRRTYGPQFDDDLIEEMAKWNKGNGVRSAKDVEDFLVEANSAERVMVGQSTGRVRPDNQLFVRILTSARNAERRDALLPMMTPTQQLRSRARMFIAPRSGVRDAAGRRTVGDLYESTDSATVAAKVSDDYEQVGKAEGQAQRSGLAGKIPGAGGRKKAVNTVSARVDRTMRMFARRPNGETISIDTARDTDKVFKFARAFFSSYHAKVLTDAFRNGTPAERRLILNGLNNSALEARGINVKFAQEMAAGGGLEAEKYQRILATGSRPSEKYAPTVAKPMSFPRGMEPSGRPEVERPPVRPGLDPGFDVPRPAAAAAAADEAGDFASSASKAFRDVEGDIYTNPSKWGDREHALHLWQTADQIRLPDYAAIEDVQQRAGVWWALFGWTNKQGMQTLTDYWSLGTLVGPRYVIRNTIEDQLMWWMTAGRWSDVYRGRRGDTVIRAVRGGQIRNKWLGFGKETKEYSRLGLINRFKKGASKEELVSQSVSRFVFDNLRPSQREALRIALADGDKKVIDESIALAMVQAKVSAISQRDADMFTFIARSGYGQHLYDEMVEAPTFLNSASSMDLADRLIAASVGKEGTALGVLKDNARFTGEWKDLRGQGPDVSPGFVIQWHRSISGVVNSDGPIGKIALANLRKAHFKPAQREAVAKRIAQVIEDDKTWGYKERFSAFYEQGATAQEFAERYLTDVMNLFTKADGSFNAELWKTVVKAPDKPKAAPVVVSDAARRVPPSWLDTDFYAVLGVEREAGERGLKAAYRRRMREVHPDVNPTDPLAVEKTRAVQEAFEVLSDAERRSLYDEATATVTPTGAGEFVPFTISMDGLDTNMLKKMRAEDRPQFLAGRETTVVPLVTNMTAADRIWEILGAQYARVSRAPQFLGNAAREYRKLEGYEQWLTGIVGEDVARRRVQALAADRAYNMTLSYVDNPANRTLFAWNMRNVSRYYRATEDFVRRMMRVGRNYPEGIWKVALTYDALDETGFVWTDENGDKYFMYPGTEYMLGAVNQVLARFGMQTMDINPMSIGGKLLMIAPSTDPNQLTWSFSGPMAFPVKAVFDQFPQFSGIERAVMGEYAASTQAAAWEQLMPAGFMRLLRMFNTDERSSMYANAVKSASQIAAAAGFVPQSLSMEDTQRWKAQVGNLALQAMVMKTALGYVLPASPQLYETDVTLIARQAGISGMRPAFLSMVAAEGDSPTAFTDAMVKWVETYGASLAPYTVSKTEAVDGLSETGAQVALNAVTDQAYDFVRDNKDVIDRFPVASTYLFPRDGDFSWKMWAWWFNNDYRRDSTTEDFQQRILAAEGNNILLEGRQIVEARIAEAKAAGNDELASELADNFASAKRELSANYPWMDIEKADKAIDSYTDGMNRLLNGDVYRKGELREMVDWYFANVSDVPQSIVKISEAIDTYDWYTTGEGDGNGGLYRIIGSSEASRNERARIKEGLVSLLTQIGSEDPQAGLVVDRVLLPLLNAGVKPYDWSDS